MNFFMAHLISLIFLMMTKINQENNWLIKSGHDHES
jgi:hypothetical protein